MNIKSILTSYDHVNNYEIKDNLSKPKKKKKNMKIHPHKPPEIRFNYKNMKLQNVIKLALES